MFLTTYRSAFEFAIIYNLYLEKQIVVFIIIYDENFVQ